MMPRTIGTMLDLSVLCFYDACPECYDPDCLCHCHDLDDLEPLELDEAAERAAEIEYDTRARRREATR
jgi:hypothetical protein